MIVITNLVVTRSFTNKYLLINIKSFAECYSVKVFRVFISVNKI